MRLLNRNKEDLLDGLAQYGYTLVRPLLSEKPEVLLSHLVGEEDVRLLEGFPVVLANVMKNYSKLDWEKKGANPVGFRNEAVRSRFVHLLVFSCLLFKLYGLEAKRLERAEALVKRFDPKHKVLDLVSKNFMESKEVRFAGLSLSTERLKNTFLNYAVHSDENESEALKKKQHELGLELLLSELFTPKQKNLLRKKMSGQKLSKTEGEYFSRVVKKRLKALASEELHQMARQVLS